VDAVRLPGGDVVAAAYYTSVLAKDEDPRRSAVPLDAVQAFALRRLEDARQENLGAELGVFLAPQPGFAAP